MTMRGFFHRDFLTGLGCLLALGVAFLVGASCSDDDGGEINTPPEVSAYVEQEGFDTQSFPDGSNQVLVGLPVRINGTATYDPDGNGLTYSWSLESVPDESAISDADIEGADTNVARFTPDVVGEYVVRFEADDSTDATHLEVKLRARAYSTGTPLESAPGDARDPDMAVVGESGDAVVVWVQQDEEFTWGIYGNVFDAAQESWSGEVLIAGVMTEPGPPHVEVDGAGNAMAVWTQNETGRRLFGSRYERATDTWTPAEAWRAAPATPKTRRSPWPKMGTPCWSGGSPAKSSTSTIRSWGVTLTLEPPPRCGALQRSWTTVG